MHRKITWTPPSVSLLIFGFLLVMSCKRASNFEGGNQIGNKTETMQSNAPSSAIASDAIGKSGPIQLKLEEGDGAQEPPIDADNAQKEDVIDRKVIKTGDVRFKTSDLDKTRQTIINAVNGLKGYINEESQTGGGDYSEMHLTVRIPAQYFDSLLSVISSNAEYFDSKNIHTEDVTEEYIDVATRIKAKKSLESQYLTILKEAKSIKEIMEVRQELNTVRTEIESTEGRLRYLSNQVAYSTLSLVFYKEIMNRGGSPRGFWSRVGDGLVEGWHTLLDIVVGLVASWPVLLIFGGLFLGFRRFWRWKKTKKETPQ